MHKAKDRLVVVFGYQHLQFMERFYNDKDSAFLERKDDLPIFLHVDHGSFAHGPATSRRPTVAAPTAHALM
jgi:hypothetical protein